MSCNHKDALNAMQKAGEFKAMRKLLFVLLDKYPHTVKRAWQDVDLSDHLCPICKKLSLRKAGDYMPGAYACENCFSVLNKYKVSP